MKIVNESIETHINEFDIILVGTNIVSSMRHGFQKFISDNYPYVQEKNLSLKYGDMRRMGTMLVIQKEGNPDIVLCFIQKSFSTNKSVKSNLDYDALRNVLKLSRIRFNGKRIASTIMGNSIFEGGGDKDKILQIFEEELKDADITLFDYTQKSRDEMRGDVYREELKLKETDRKEYYKRVKERKNKYKWQKKSL